METFQFSLIFDLPLTVLVLLCFLANAWIWAKSDDPEKPGDIEARLPKAIIRYSLFFLGLLAFCWYVNLGVWPIFLTLLVIGLFFSAIAGNSLAPEFMFIATAGVLREWAFGFPHLILTPNTQSHPSKSNESQVNDLVGARAVTISPLRPAGEIRVNDEEFAAISDDGTLIEKGSEVVIVAIQNSRARVRLPASNPPNDQ